MDELDEIWQQMMRNAAIQAETSGRNDVADYLALKISNDAIRTESSKWLFNSFLEILQNSNNREFVQIETDSPHQFEMNSATMIGSRLRFRQGLRCMEIEAGWTRTPKDGFMRGNALAFARILHFGMAKNNLEIHLKRSSEIPKWFAVDRFGNQEILRIEHLQAHFHIFTT
jgi:hypothetical protein